MLVFVYGTLKKGYGNHGVLKGATYIQKYKTLHQHKMLDLGAFPGVVHMGGDTAITGEIYKITEEISARLDQLEGYPTFYDKVNISTTDTELMMYVLSKQFLEARTTTLKELPGEWL